MIRALRLNFTPAREWEKIGNETRGVIWVLCLYLLPLMAISGFVEGEALMKWGDRRGEFGELVRQSIEVVLRYEAVSLGIVLLVAFIGSSLVLTVSRSFQVNVEYWQCFAAVGYSLGPLILVKILDAFPGINTWLCWGIGMAMVASMLYHGVALCIKPDQTKGFGIFTFSVVFIGLLSGLGHFISNLVLHGKLLRPEKPAQHAVIGADQRLSFFRASLTTHPDRCKAPWAAGRSHPVNS
jgi:hypothetical protein